MKLLKAATSGVLWTGSKIPDDVRIILFDAGLFLSAASVKFQIDYDNPLNFSVTKDVAYDITKPEKPGPDEYWTQELTIKQSGCLAGRSNRIVELVSGFNQIKNAIEICENQEFIDAANDLKDILVRLNLLMELELALKSNDDAFAMSVVMAMKIDNCLEIFNSFAIISPYLIARALRQKLLYKLPIADEPDNWEIYANAGYEFWETGDELAEKARSSESFVDLLSYSLESIPFYHAAVLMLRDAMSCYSRVKGEKPLDLMRDYGVVEEYRVGAIEMLTYFGFLIAARPAYFLKDCEGLPLNEAIRKALLATRSQISVYPERIQKFWFQLIENSGRQNEILQDSLSTGYGLRAEIGKVLPSAFKDSDFVIRAFQIFETYRYQYFRVNLQEGWQQKVFNINKSLLDFNVISPSGMKNSIAYRFSGNQLISEILGIEWPFSFEDKA